MTTKSHLCIGVHKWDFLLWDLIGEKFQNELLKKDDLSSINYWCTCVQYSMYGPVLAIQPMVFPGSVRFVHSESTCSTGAACRYLLGDATRVDGYSFLFSGLIRKNFCYFRCSSAYQFFIHHLLFILPAPASFIRFGCHLRHLVSFLLSFMWLPISLQVSSVSFSMVRINFHQGMPQRVLATISTR